MFRKLVRFGLEFFRECIAVPFGSMAGWMLKKAMRVYVFIRDFDPAKAWAEFDKRTTSFLEDFFRMH